MKHKPGPKLEDGVGEVRPYQVTLDETTAEMLKAVGGGKISRGVRVAARVAYKAFQAEPEQPSGEVAARP